MNNKMNNEVVKIISNYMTLTDELKQIIDEITVVRNYDKGAILLREGQMANDKFIVSKGCIRSYVIDDGEEKTLEFYTEGQSVMPTNYDNGVPSIHYLDCIEDTVAYVSNSKHEKEMMHKFPQLESICNMMYKMSDKVLSDCQLSFTDYRTTSAKDRYLKLFKERPDLIQRVPQYMLASYLGVKPETLSRIRRRLGRQ